MYFLNAQLALHNATRPDTISEELPLLNVCIQHCECVSVFVSVCVRSVLGGLVLEENGLTAEIYIMAAHWAFIIPICIGYIIRNCKEKYLPYFRGGLAVITIFLFFYNSTLIFEYLTR